MHRTPRQVPRHKRQAGQTLVEFALVLPIFLLLVFGLFDVGRFVYTDATLSQAAREGARLAATEAPWVGVTATGNAGCVATPGAIVGTNPGAHVCPLTAAALDADVRSAVNRMVAGLTQISIVYLSCNDGTTSDPAPTGAWTNASGGNDCTDWDATSGTYIPIGQQHDLVSVRIEYTYQPITPVIGQIIGSVVRTASATMVIN
jgi:Flp pilus assembly protein TadG